MTDVPIYVLAGQSNAEFAGIDNRIVESALAAGNAFEFVKTALGGTSIYARSGADWDPSSSNELFSQLVAAVNIASANVRAQGQTPQVVLLWVQGESDVGLGMQLYANKLTSFINLFRQGVGDADAPVAISSLPYPCDVRTAQDLVAATVPNVSVIDTTGAMTFDTVHYERPTRLFIADQFFAHAGISPPTIPGYANLLHGATSVFDGTTEKVTAADYQDFTYTSGDRPQLVNSNSGDDIITTGSGDDTIYTLGNDDVVHSGGGNDFVDLGDHNDIAYGGTGNDVLLGQKGQDQLYGEDGNDYLNAGSQNDVLFGGAGFDTLFGDEGDDILSGGADADTIDGGIGIDTADYDDSSAGVTVDLRIVGTWQASAGTASGDKLTGIENLRGSKLADRLTGDAGNNVLDGNTGDDILTGGAGDDTLIGGIGKDNAAYSGYYGVYAIDRPAGTVTSSAEGLDTLSSIETLTFADGSYDWVSGLFTSNGLGVTITGTSGNDTISGSATVPGQPKVTAYADTIYGLGGDDTLNGGVGADTMIGGMGNDTYTVDNAGDVVTELGNEGTDTVRTGLSYTLGANVENLELLYNGQSWGTGNALANVITGNIGNNVLNGGAGADTMTGGLGNDTYVVDNIGDVVTELAGEGTDTVQTGLSYTLGANLENLTLLYNGKCWGSGNELGNTIIGNIGDNVLRGLAGNDTLTGGLGADAFVFNTGLNATTNVDTITDFSIAQGDVFWLEDAVFRALAPGVLQAGDFVTGTAATNAAQNVIYDSTTGSLFYDADGLGGVAQVKFASVTPGIAMTAGNFLVV